MTRWLVTRPAAETARFAAAMAEIGAAAVPAPVIEIEPLDPGPLDLRTVQAVLATSANGISGLARLTGRRDLPVLAVGDATAEAARGAGFAAVESAAGDGAALAALALARLDPADGAVLHPSGADIAFDLGAALAGAGFAVRRVVVYRARPAAALPAAAAAALAAGEVSGAVFFSPRSAEVFARLAREAGLADRLRDLVALCLSPAVARRLDDGGWGTVRVAERPDAPALLALFSASQTDPR